MPNPTARVAALDSALERRLHVLWLVHSSTDAEVNYYRCGHYHHVWHVPKDQQGGPTTPVTGPPTVKGSPDKPKANSETSSTILQ